MVSVRKEQRSAHKDLNQLAELTLGIKQLSVDQQEAIEAVLSGRDTLAILPTGSGKSAIYQVAGHLLPGPTVVISPLIALQRDQAEKLESAEAGEAALINSSVSGSSRDAAMEAAKRGEVEFLFLAPEQLENEAAVQRLVDTRPSLLVVDEAHCISAWGHDFRPDYLALTELVERLGHPTLLALTATASTPVQEEIIERLAMRRPRLVTQSVDRPNIRLEVRRFDDESTKRVSLIETVREESGPGVVYVATRAKAEELADALAGEGVNAACYHAGLATRIRNGVQERFMAGELEVVVATKAFGMGVDKANVRFVFHGDVSDSIDSYAQEIGRAGRDNGPANAVLFYNPGDIGLQRFFAGGKLQDADIAAVLRAFPSARETLTRKAIGERSGLGPRKVVRVLNGLIDAGLIRRSGSGGYRPVRQGSPMEQLDEVESLQEQWRRVNESRVEMMRLYAEEDSCRRQLLLSYFGDSLERPCANCDNCERGAEASQTEGTLVEVVHQAWGIGRVLRQEADRAVVFFQSVGYKTLDLKVALERGLLKMPPAAAN